MMAAPDRTGTLLLLVIAMALVLLGATSSAGYFIIDEVIYFIGAETLHNTGGFAVQNGVEKFASNDLKLWLLVNGPRGLVPQYPVGTAVTAAPLIGLFGQKSLIVLNVLAGLGTLLTTHALTRRLFGSTEVANLAVVLLALCTFWAEYVVGHWPHSISVFLISLAIYLFLEAIDREKSAWHPAFWSGVLVGVGMFFRLESVLLLPAIAAVTFLYAQSPLQVFTGGAAGLTPITVLLAWSNKIRFGTLSPLSYGSSGGGTDVSSYLPLGAIILAFLAGLVLLRLVGKIGRRGYFGITVAALLGLGIVMLLPLAPFLEKLAGGAKAILIDATAIHDPRLGAMNRLQDGTVLFWGLPKKALGQSLPWLGCLALLIGLSWGERRRSIVIVLIVFATWSLPFVMRSWHGGLGSNMRYLLPTLPLLAALSAWLILELRKRAVGTEMRLVLLAAIGGFVLPTIWILAAPTQIFLLHQKMSTNLLFVIAALSLLASYVPRRIAAQVALYTIGAGLGFSSFLAFQDFNTAQMRRAGTAIQADAVATIPGRILFYGAPERYASAFGKPEQFLALPDRITLQMDYDLVDAACRSGYRILMIRGLAEGQAELNGRFTEFDWDLSSSMPPMVELTCES